MQTPHVGASDSSLQSQMQPAQIIRDAIAEVQRLRQESECRQSLSDAVSAVKRFQSRRFAATYQDLITGGPYQAAAKFFLTELYSEANYSSRDAQFAKIAGAIQRLLPNAAVSTAVSLAQLHALTERLDLAMGHAWAQDLASADTICLSARYARAWRAIGDENARQQQLELVLEVGRELDTLTQTPGLHLLLKLMRKPAKAAGLGELQHFLEKGFDTFEAMGQKKGATGAFLRLIDQRETKMLKALFAGTQKDVCDHLAFMEKTR